jgi:hypothetical protein
MPRLINYNNLTVKGIQYSEHQINNVYSLNQLAVVYNAKCVYSGGSRNFEKGTHPRKSKIFQLFSVL